MPRRKGFIGVVTAIARETARQQRVTEAARRRQQREMESVQRHDIREATRHERELKKEKAQENREANQLHKEKAQADKEAQQQYLEDRIIEVGELNSEVQEKILELSRILEHTLDIDDTISFNTLKINDEFPDFYSPNELQTPIQEPERHTFLNKVIRPSGLKSFVPGAKSKYERERKHAEEEFRLARERWKIDEESRLEQLETVRREYADNKCAFERKKEQRNAEVEEFEKAYQAADPDAIVAYNSMVLERSDYPYGFPKEFRIAFVPDSKQMVIEYQLPTVDMIPLVLEYRYVKMKDEISEKSRKQTEIKTLYQDILASTSLRTIHEVLEADQYNHIDTVCFNGFIQTVDPATGQDIRPHLISVRTTRERFNEIDLARIDKRVCLKNLGAQVSSRPSEAQAVKPVVEFDMVDHRFVDQSDVLGDLESRPNLMELNPYEFEHLVANLFEQMGLESKLTRSSKDGGVDCVAFDSRPILGGKVVIQAKRYRHTVGVSAVRDLYGTMMNEGANKGILVTTSGYGPDAFDFSKDKPIELVDGAGLLYLLQQAGVEARIILPE